MPPERSTVAFGSSSIDFEIRRSNRRATVSIAVEPAGEVVVTARRGEPCGPSGLPNRFFCPDQLLGHLCDHLVLAGQTSPEPLVLREQLLLPAGLDALARFPEGRRAVLAQRERDRWVG
jgi:hypothetical protein